MATTTQILGPVLVPPTKNFIDVTADFFATRLKEPAKLIYGSIDIFKWLGFVDSNNIQAQRVHSAATYTKLMLGPIEVLQKSITLKDKVTGYQNNKATGAEVFFAANGMMGSVWDSAELMEKFGFVEKGTPVMRALNGLNGVALTVGMSKQFVDNVDKISQIDLTQSAQLDQNMQRMAGHLFAVAKAISYIALGICIICSIFFNLVAPAIVFTVFAFAATVFASLQYYAEELNKPITDRQTILLRTA